MMYLHEDRELFEDTITLVAERLGMNAEIIEKDYYVTLILKELAGTKYPVVFKGGTSLSKAFGIINRFSEDIDITFSEHLGKTRRKHLKYDILKPVGDKLCLELGNWDDIESNKNLNHYDFYYKPVINASMGGLPSFVKVETALMSYAFPTVMKDINNYIYTALCNEELELISEYGLEPFVMRVQAPERTLIDKIFAVCDYYLLNRPYRNSRHLYDILKIGETVIINDELRKLTEEVWHHRQKMGKEIAPSAQLNMDIPELAMEIITKDFYRTDYENVTGKLITDGISYETVAKYYENMVKKIFA